MQSSQLDFKYETLCYLLTIVDDDHTICPDKNKFIAKPSFAIYSKIPICSKIAECGTP